VDAEVEKVRMKIDEIDDQIIKLILKTLLKLLLYKFITSAVSR